jgi:uncharacterized damage-inducible protein DinB
MHPLLVPTGAILELNGALLLNALAGLDDQTAAQPLGTSHRRVDHIAAHLLDARGFLGTLMDVDVQHGLATVLSEAMSFEVLGDRAPLSAVRTAWVEFSPALAAKLEQLEPARLDTPAVHRLPISDHTLLGAITFLLHHESYHIGQLGLLRRELGFPAVQYPTVQAP